MSWLLYNYIVLGVVLVVAAATVAQETTTNAPTDETVVVVAQETTTDAPTEEFATTAPQDDRTRDPIFSVWEFARFGGSGNRRPRPTLPTTPPPPTTTTATKTTTTPVPQPAADTVATVEFSPFFDPTPGPTYSPCFWAIVLCCGADVPHEREGCFEEAECPGAWIGNLCSEKLKAKVRRKLFFG